MIEYHIYEKTFCDVVTFRDKDRRKELKYLFKPQIKNWQDWLAVYQNVPEFLPLIQAVFRRENLKLKSFAECMSGTHFVARFGNMVIKIYAPEESGNGSGDCTAEVFGLTHAAKQGVYVSKLIAYGEIRDRYVFSYIVTEYIDGLSYETAKRKMTSEQRYETGRRIRTLCNKINIPVDHFVYMDILKEAKENPRWSVWKESFNQERIKYYYESKFFSEVFVHGDLSENNIILKDGVPYMIDFGESKTAPVQYEYAEIFRFDSAFRRGYSERTYGF